ncbi:MAG: gamma-glutamyl-gamma-aminobutyrate hydrolase family protein [Anaerolineaceae bacterium]|nr:gamma-glutamyl-gamma-aminobutyrate hydrolase family protein [Anaerolineaceae bacterium]
MPEAGGRQLVDRPVIGLATAGRRESRNLSKHYRELYTVPTQYVDAIRRAGGLPVLLPPGVPAWMGGIHLDGMIATGGGDLDPALYGGDSAHPQISEPDAERDETEMQMMRWLARGDLPSLMICRGLQALNVALGGTLIEHIPDHVHPDIHRSPGGSWSTHPVSVEPDSLLERCCRGREVSTVSSHHQAIRDLAPGLRVVSQAPDGIIEAVEKPDHPFLLAVQWHPEVSADVDPQQQALFDALVAFAAGRREEVEALPEALAAAGQLP